MSLACAATDNAAAARIPVKSRLIVISINRMGPVLCRIEAEALEGAHPNRAEFAVASRRMREVVRLGWRNGRDLKSGIQGERG
jgi:hypothetical protein